MIDSQSQQDKDGEKLYSVIEKLKDHRFSNLLNLSLVRVNIACTAGNVSGKAPF
jgi:hypothetical protein